MQFVLIFWGLSEIFVNWKRIIKTLPLANQDRVLFSSYHRYTYKHPPRAHVHTLGYTHIKTRRGLLWRPHTPFYYLFLCFENLLRFSKFDIVHIFHAFWIVGNIWRCRSLDSLANDWDHATLIIVTWNYYEMSLEVSYPRTFLLLWGWFTPLIRSPFSMF